MTIRPVQPQDYEALVSIRNSIYETEQYSAREYKHLDDSVKEPCKFARFVAEENGEIVGSAEYSQHLGSYHPQKFYIEIFVDKNYQGKGIGSALYNKLLEELKQFNPTSFTAQAREAEKDSVSFLEKRGFKETKRDWESVLDLDSFQPEDHSESLQRLKDENITLQSLTEWGLSDEHCREFFEFYSEVRLDVPRSEPATPMTFEYFMEVIINAPDFYKDGTFLAFSGDQIVGMTMFWKSEASNDLFTGLTAVKREFRKKGIATGLKVHALTFAKEQGADKVFTDNDTKNVGMLGINEKLGFKRLPARISMKKEF